MKTKFIALPTLALGGLVGTASAAVPTEVTGILTDIGAVNTAVATVAAVVVVTWMAFRLAKRAGK